MTPRAFRDAVTCPSAPGLLARDKAFSCLVSRFVRERDVSGARAKTACLAFTEPGDREARSAFVVRKQRRLEVSYLRARMNGRHE